MERGSSPFTTKTVRERPEATHTRRDVIRDGPAAVSSAAAHCTGAPRHRRRALAVSARPRAARQRQTFVAAVVLATRDTRTTTWLPRQVHNRALTSNRSSPPSNLAPHSNRASTAGAGDGVPADVQRGPADGNARCCPGYGRDPDEASDRVLTGPGGSCAHARGRQEDS
jgi:hypothetical protein